LFHQIKNKENLIACSLWNFSKCTKTPYSGAFNTFLIKIAQVLLSVVKKFKLEKVSKMFSALFHHIVRYWWPPINHVLWVKVFSIPGKSEIIIKNVWKTWLGEKKCGEWKTGYKNSAIKQRNTDYGSYRTKNKVVNLGPTDTRHNYIQHNKKKMRQYNNTQHFNIQQNKKMRYKITTFSILTFSIRHSITTRRIMILSTYAECPYAQCRLCRM